MAKLSAHGTEIGRVMFTTYAKAYMSDGVVLKNAGGSGWKIHGRIKEGVTPTQAYENQKRHQEQYLAQRPEVAAYRKELHKLAGIGKAWKLHTAISLLGNDVDGIWSEVCDGYSDNVHADVDEISHLVQLYNTVREIHGQVVTE